MELIVLPAARHVDPDSGCLVLAHDQSGLATPRVPGDEVVILDVDGDYHAGAVTALLVRDGRLHYRLRLGVRLPPDAAQDRLRGGSTSTPASGVTDQSLLDLLGELRDSGDDPDHDPGHDPAP